LGVLNGEVHAFQSPRSRRHSNVSLPTGSVAVNEKVPTPPWMAGPERIVVSGGVRSTVKLHCAGVGSALPAGSAERAWTVCGASPTLVVHWEVHPPQLPESTRHWKVAPGWGDVNPNETVALLPSTGGPEVAVVSAATVSMVNWRTAGVPSVFPTWSMAR